MLAELAGLLPDAALLTAFATGDVAGWPQEIVALAPRVTPGRIQPLFELAERVPGAMPILLPLLPWGMRRSFSRELARVEREVVSDAGLAKTVALETPAPVEAIARGCPVVALGSGGATETIEPGVTGVFFAEPKVDAVIAAVEAAGQTAWDCSLMYVQAGRIRSRAVSRRNQLLA